MFDTVRGDRRELFIEWPNDGRDSVCGWALLPSGASVRRTRDASFSHRVVYSGTLKVNSSVSFGGSTAVSVATSACSLSDCGSFVLLARSCGFDLSLLRCSRDLVDLLLDSAVGPVFKDSFINASVNSSIARASLLLEGGSCCFARSPYAFKLDIASAMSSSSYDSFMK